MALNREDIAEYLAFAHTLAEAAADVAMPHFRSPIPVIDKGQSRFDPVTVADKAAEQAMRARIQHTYPAHGILGEEHAPVTGSSAVTWVLDPIDGTRSFITGMPLWATLIAVNDGTRPCIVIMNQPYTGERFVGTPDGAWLNGQPIHTQPCAELSHAKLMCTGPDIFNNAQQRETFYRIADQARLVRFGGDSYAYCMLAMGMVDVVMEAGLQPYDVQALIPIVESAGGVITAWDGGDPQHGGTVLACGDPALHGQILDRLQG